MSTDREEPDDITFLVVPGRPAIMMAVAERVNRHVLVLGTDRIASPGSLGSAVSKRANDRMRGAQGPKLAVVWIFTEILYQATTRNSQLMSGRT